MDSVVEETVNKKLLRSQLIRKRLMIDEATAREASMDLAHHIQNMIPSHNYVIAGYAPTRGEIDIFPALRRLAQRGHKLCLPMVTLPDMPLTFRHWQPGEPLEKGVYNIAVPSSAAPKLLPDIVIVPLVAFDQKGYRLGYGAGYYDRTINALRDTKPIQVLGAGYAMQQIKNMPSEIHDEKLDAVVTELGVTRFA